MGTSAQVQAMGPAVKEQAAPVARAEDGCVESTRRRLRMGTSNPPPGRRSRRCSTLLLGRRERDEQHHRSGGLSRNCPQKKQEKKLYTLALLLSPQGPPKVDKNPITPRQLSSFYANRESRGNIMHTPTTTRHKLLRHLVYSVSMQRVRQQYPLCAMKSDYGKLIITTYG